MATDFVTCRCPMCGGVSNPSNGCEYTPTFVVCERCVREFWAWVRQRMNSRPRGGRGPSFYDHVNVVSPPIEVTT